MKFRRAVLGNDWVEMKIPMSRALRDQLRMEARRENQSLNSLLNERLANYIASQHTSPMSA